MKKILIFATIAAGLFTLVPTKAEAGNYRSKIVGSCQGCNKNIYSYYRPVRNSRGRVYNAWVPSYHNHCGSRNRGNGRAYYGRSIFFSGFWGGGWGGGHHGGWGGGHHGGWGGGGHHGGHHGGHGHGGHH